jgi:SOS-response transcriptional repressor LexA
MNPGEKNPILERIDRELARQGKSREAISKEAGLSRDYLRKMGTRSPKGSGNLAAISKIEKALGFEGGELLAEITKADPDEGAKSITGEIRRAKVKRGLTEHHPRDLPVVGRASGALANGLIIDNDAVDLVFRPPALSGIDQAYAIYVTGESMVPLHKPGDLCFVHPGRPCLRGDSVIIQLKHGESKPIEGYIKTFIRANEEWIIAQQYNPPCEVKYKKAFVYRMHHVLTMKELFGV